MIYFCTTCYEFVRDNEEISVHHEATGHDSYITKDQYDTDSYRPEDTRSYKDIAELVRGASNVSA